MRRLLVPAVLLGWSCSAAFAGDWPQILGPNRNGEAIDEHLADRWPADGLKTVWQQPVGSGYAGLAVSAGKAILFHRSDNDERAAAMDCRTGEVLWKSGSPTTYRPAFVEDNGPRCVPVIVGDRVIVFGSQGRLRCLNLADGSEIWSHATHEEYRAPEGYFGAGSSPLVVGDRVLVNVGGAKQGTSIVAFSLADGKVLWTAIHDAASYSSPILADAGGSKQAIFVTRSKTVSLNPENGEVNFEFPFGKRGPTVNGANPVMIDGQLFVTASYGVGGLFAQPDGQAAKTLWSNDDLMSSQYTTCVQHTGYLFGVHGRQDVGDADLRCFDPKTQKIAWTKEGFGYATLIKADGKLLIMKTDGTLVLAALDPAEYRELARTKLLTGTARALPALSNGLFYVRDETTLKCVELPTR